MQDIRSRLFLLIGGSLLLIVVLLLAIYFGLKQKGSEIEDGSAVISITNTDTPSVYQQQDTQPQEIPSPQNVPVVSTEAPQERYVRQLARIFVERFETRSSHNDNRHIDDVKSLVTSQMLDWIETQTQEQQYEYQGKTVQVISSDLTTFESAKATVVVGVQEVLQTRSGQETKQKQGRVEFENVGDVWKVSGLYWDKE